MTLYFWETVHVTNYKLQLKLGARVCECFIPILVGCGTLFCFLRLGITSRLTSLILNLLQSTKTLPSRSQCDAYQINIGWIYVLLGFSYKLVYNVYSLFSQTSMAQRTAEWI